MSKLFKKKKPVENSDGEMTLVGHLNELRSRIGAVVVVFLIAFIVCFIFVREFADVLLSMGRDAGFTFVYLSPSELLTSYFKLSLIAGLCVALPMALYEAWCFIAPALSDTEKKAGRGALLGGFLFFVLGVIFAYTIALPAMVQFLVKFNTSTYIKSSISVAEYLNFLVGIIMTFGLIFEMPILALLLSSVGILKPEYMIKTRKYAILLVFIVAAIITPPDVLSQIMVALPMIALYQVSIWVSAAVWKRKKKKEAEEAAQDEPEEKEEEKEPSKDE